MSNKKVYITGIGITSSIGLNTDQTLEAILKCQTGIGHIQHLDTYHKGKLLVGEVKVSNQGLLTALEIPVELDYSRTALLGMMAAREAYDHAQLGRHQSLRTGLISSTSVGGIDKTEKFYQAFLSDPNAGSLNDISAHDCGDSTEKIADDLEISDFVTTISTACSSSANAIMLGARMIRSGRLDRVVAGGVDALTKYTLNGFNALRILDERYCRPFSQNRNGLNLGEGAAYIVLESEESVKSSHKLPLCELAGYGNANDAHHQTASSPDGIGAFYAMQLALERSGLAPEKIDYINAHGTATINNDLSEGTAFKNLFKDYLPVFSSTKSFTGHTLAAAGAIEAVLSILSMQHQILIPTLNFDEPISELSIEPITELTQNTVVNKVLSNSFGFGGNCSSLVLVKN